MPAEQLRNVLVIALAFVTFLMWQAWRQDYGPKPAAPAPAQTGAPPPGAQAPETPAAAPDVPVAPQAPGAETAASPGEPAPAATASAPRISITTDVLRAEIDPEGGTLEILELLRYPVSVDQPDRPFTLFKDTSPNLFIAQSGLLGAALPNHRARFVADRRDYALADGAQELRVPLRWRSGPVEVVKTFVFRRDRYLITVEQEIRNAGDDPLQGRAYGQFQREEVAAKGGLFRTYTYTGGVISTPDKPYEKIAFSDMANTDLKRQSQGGWVAMIQHYFAGAWIPAQDAANYFYTKALPASRYVLGLMAPPVTVAPGETARLELGLYAGPKIADRLQRVAPNLERTIDYGWLWFIAQPLFWLLKFIHDLLGNWGWSIIILTMLIKAAFFHLSATSYKSMARMRKLQPRIVALRERYANDKQRMNQAMMELYREEKINPLGGCLPILVQIPVFIALYWTLLESVELRQAPFIFWIRDLSTYDPYFVLPILMGITMLVQQKLNPAPPDPLQAKIMMALPFVFTFLFLFFPSGLVLYWFVNNCLSIVQQWVITRKIVGPAST